METLLQISSLCFFFTFNLHFLWCHNYYVTVCGVCVCMQSLYKKHAVEFLLDVGDTVHAYEERGRSRDPGLSELELEQSALSQMNHVQKIEVLQGERWLPSSLLNDHFSVAILAAETRTF